LEDSHPVEHSNVIAASRTLFSTRGNLYELDTRTYPKGSKVSEEEMASLNIKGDAFHPEWNYTISPGPP
jgi:hypothetical protein